MSSNGRAIPCIVFACVFGSALIFGCAKNAPPPSKPQAEREAEPKSEAAAEPDEEFKPMFVVPEVDAAYYDSVLPALRSGDVSRLAEVDFLKMRFSYIKGAHLEVPSEVEDAFYEAAGKRDYQKQVELADEILETDFTDIKIHLMKAMAMEKLGRDSEFHNTVAKGLIESILTSGDGQTPQTAWHVAQVKEEYALIMIFGMRSNMQSLFHKGDHSFDILECQDEEGKNVTFYFDITEHMKRIQALFQ